MPRQMPSGATILVVLGGLLLIGWVVAALWPWLVGAVVVIGAGMALSRGGHG